MSNSFRNDDVIRVLGAGPAGLTAAITLARAGRAVVVSERAPAVGSRHDGDDEAMENWSTRADLSQELATSGIEINFRCVPIHTLTCFGPGFRGTAQIQDSNPLFYVVQRGAGEHSLDRGLLAQARDAGVQVEFNANQPLDQVDIVATGFPRARAYVVGYTFSTRLSNACYICLDSRLSPSLYSYLITCEGRGTVGFGAGAPPPKNITEILDRVAAGFQSRINLEIESPRRFAAAGTFGLPQTARQDGRLYVGEAADLQDPLFGFGLRISMITGHLAARSILEHCDYDLLWKGCLMPQLQAALVHRMLFQIMGNMGYRWLLPYMRLFAQRGRELCHKHYQPMWYTHLLLPPAKRRWLNERRWQDHWINPARPLRRETLAAISSTHAAIQSFKEEHDGTR